MADPEKYQARHNGPLKPEYVKFLNEMKAENNWSYKTLGDKLHVSGAFTYNILNKNMNITTNPYMLKIAMGIERLEQNDFVKSESENKAPSATRRYVYPLRDDLEASLVLPKDLTEKEAERLSLFIRSLPQ